MDIFDQISGTDDKGDIFDSLSNPADQFTNTSKNPAVEFGKSALRGIGRAGANILDRSAFQQEEASLPALLGMKPDVSTERNIAQTLRENVPDESEEFLPSVVGAGIESIADPASWLGGGIPSFVMGATGKALERAGAPKWLQIAGEMGSVLFTKNPKQVFTAKSPEIRAAQDIMKEAGLTEKEIVLATNALKEKSTLEGAAKMYKSTEKIVESSKDKLEKGVNKIIGESFPGFEKGIEEVEARAAKLFEPVKEESKNLVIMRPEKFTNSIDNILKDIQNTLANSPDEQSFITMLRNASDSAIAGRTAEPFINFYQTLNRIGKWVDPSKKEKYMRAAKDSIKETFRDNGPIGNKLAKEFEEANLGWSKYNQAEKVNKLLEKSYVDEKLDFSKLSKNLSNDKNFDVFKKALGEKPSANLKAMSKIGQQLERSAEAIKGSFVKQGVSLGKVFSTVSALISLNPYAIASTIGGAGALELGQYIATQMLVNPKYQNLWIKLANKLKSGSVIEAKRISDEIQENAEREFNSSQSK